jgi:hypothetical protein
MASMLGRRRYPRYMVQLPLRLKRVAGNVEPTPMILHTRDISKTGLRFDAKRRIEPGQSIEVEVILAGCGPDGKDTQVSGTGYIVRVEDCDESGLYQLAAIFDEGHSTEEPGWNQLAAAFE